MLQLGKLDLQLALAAARALREDVDDEFGTVGDPDLPEPLQIALLYRADRMVEENQRDVLFLESGAETFGGAAAEKERGIRTWPPDDLAQRRCQPGGAGQGIQFIEAVGVQALAVDGDRKQRGLCRDDVVGEIIAGRIRFQLSGLSWWKSTARAGTTVEIACL